MLLDHLKSFGMQESLYRQTHNKLKLISDYEALAARRYNEFLWQERKRLLSIRLFSLSMRALTRTAAVMQRVGLIRRRTPERVHVE
jgi:hypothetical protein